MADIEPTHGTFFVKGELSLDQAKALLKVTRGNRGVEQVPVSLSQDMDTWGAKRLREVLKKSPKR